MSRARIVWAILTVVVTGLVAVAPAYSQSTVPVTDLGTLGGATSEALDINDRGQVVGWSATATGDQHAFLWTVDAGMTDLGTLYDWPQSWASGINNLGQVAGETSSGTGDTHAVLWTETGMVDLGTLYGWPISEAFGINDLGDVVGSSRSGWGGPPAERRAYRWTAAGGMVDLGTLGGLESEARAINNFGQIVGWSSTPGEAEKRLVLWQPDGTIVDLGPLMLEMTGINDLGQVAGMAANWHAFLWTETGGMVDLGTPGAEWLYSAGTGINNLSQITGLGGSDTLWQAIVWTADAAMANLGTLSAEWPYSNALYGGINNFGQVVGASVDATFTAPRATLWMVPTPLNAGQTNSLLKRLENASRQMAAGNTRAACNMLGAFAHEAQAFINSGVLSQEQGQLLVDGANNQISRFCG